MVKMYKLIGKFKACMPVFLLFGLILIGLINPVSGAVVVSIDSDKNNYYLGDTVQFTITVDIANEDTCAITQAQLEIHDGSSITCNLPVIYGNYGNYGNCNLLIYMTETHHDDCLAYGGNNLLTYTVEWKIPLNWSASQEHANATVTFEGNEYSSEATFFIFSILAGDPIELIKAADTQTAKKGEIIKYTVSVENNDNQPLNVFLNDTADDDLKFVGNVTVNCNCSGYIYNETPWFFTTDPQERATDWWVNLTNLPPGCKCTVITTAEVMNMTGSSILNKVIAKSNNQTHGAVDESKITVSFPEVEKEEPEKKGKGVTYGPVSTIEPVTIVTEKKILTNITDTITPGTQCFNIKSLIQRFEDGKLEYELEKNLTNTSFNLMLPNGTYTESKTGKNGEFCFDFECGDYEINISYEDFEKYIKSFRATYGNLYITPGDFEANTGDALTYIVTDKDKNPVGDVLVNVTLPGEMLQFTTLDDGKVEFNTGEEEGGYKISAGKHCYDEGTLQGVIKREITCGDGTCEGNENCENCPGDCGVCHVPELMIDCTKEVKAGGKITCKVTDEQGNPVPGATVKLTDGSIYSTDTGGSVEFTAGQAGEIDAYADKEGYAQSKKEKIIVTMKGCLLINVKILSICWYWWLILISLIIVLILFILLMKKKKTASDLEFLLNAESEEQLDKVLDKFKKIYVTPKTYEEYMKVTGKTVDERIEEIELNDKGKEYMESVNDETVALAMQLSANIVLTESEERKKIAEDNKLKAFNLEEVVIIKKKKTVADLEFLLTAVSEDKLGEILDKFKKIYVTPFTYDEIAKIGGEVDERIEETKLNDKGKEYMESVKDETVSLAMQISAEIFLTENDARRKIAGEKEFKVLDFEEAKG